MQTWTYVSFVGVLLMKWIYGQVDAGDLESICSSADTAYLQALCVGGQKDAASSKKIHRAIRALSDDYFLRFGKSNPLWESKRFLRFGRSYGGSLGETLAIALNKLEDLESETGIKLRKRRSAETLNLSDQAKDTGELDEEARVKRDNSGADTPIDTDTNEINKRFMRFGRGDGEVDKRFMRFGRSRDFDKRFMRFGRLSQDKRFMRFGRNPEVYEQVDHEFPEKRFMRFGKRFMRFGRSDEDTSNEYKQYDENTEPERKRFMRFGKRFMRFGRSDSDMDKRFMRFGRSDNNVDKRFMRFGRSDNNNDKRFMRFGRSSNSIEKRFMRFGKRASATETTES